MAATWGAADVARGLAPPAPGYLARRPRRPSPGASWITGLQVRTWSDTATLFAHAAEVTPGNTLALIDACAALRDAGDYAGAEAQKFTEALAVHPDDGEVYGHLACSSCSRSGRRTPSGSSAAPVRSGPVPARPSQQPRRDAGGAGPARRGGGALAEAVRLGPGRATFRNNLASVLLRAGRLREAADALRETLERWPDNADAREALGRCLCNLGDAEAGVAEYRRARGCGPILPRPTTTWRSRWSSATEPGQRQGRR